MRKKAVKLPWSAVLAMACSATILLVCTFWLYTRSIPTSSPTSNATRPTVPTATTVWDTTVPTTMQTTIHTTLPTAVDTREFTWTTEQVNAINALLDGYTENISVYYQDIRSGYTYTYNPETKYVAASLMKAPYCMYILQLAAENKCDLTQKMAYTKQYESTGTGILKDQEFGTEYTIQQLIEYAIRYSDNAALRMLRAAYPIDGFKDFSRKLGIQDIAGIGYATNSNITVTDAAIYMREVNRFIRSDAVYGKILYDYMTTTRNPMMTSSYPMLRKYGWADKSFHDMALVDAPNPYILIICTDHEDGTAEDFAMFRTISQRIEKISGQTN